MALASWTQQQILDQLIYGESWSGTTITYAFPTSSAGIYGTQELSGFVALNATQQAAAERALQTWDDLIAPDMLRTTSSSSNIEFGTSSTGVSFAHAYQPSVGSIWFSRNYPELLNPQIGQHSFLTYMHEIGHALGLEHMGIYNGSGSWTPSSYEDSGVYSVMSYFGPNMNSGEGQVAWADWVGSDGKTYAPQTPMLNDVLAIQTIYGAETTTRTGDTTYGFGSNITGSMASIFDFSLNPNPILTIYDSSGIDTLNLNGWSTSSTINLIPGSYSSCNSMTLNIAIAYSCSIENAVGGSGSDAITGNLLANMLDGGLGDDNIFGGGGDDVLIASAGNDVLDGGDGNDSLVFSGAWTDFNYSYSVSNGFTLYSNATGTEIVKGVETFIFADVTKYSSELANGAASLALATLSVVSASSQAEGNSGATVFTYKVSLSGPSTSVESLDWSLGGSADPGSDFSGATSGTLTFQAGETEKTFQISVAGDTTVETDESFTVNLSNPSSGLMFTNTSIGSTILNDDWSASGDDFGTSTSNAGTMTVNGGAVSGAIETMGDGDLFKVNLTAGMTYVFDLIKTGGTIDPYLSLYPPLTATTFILTPIKSNDNAGASTSNAQITYTATSTGTYYLMAMDPWGGTGSYSISAIPFPGKTLSGDDNANTLTGTVGDDKLYGLGGIDTLTGNAGDDLLDGGLGADKMSGGTGNDTYQVDQTLDVVTEVSAGGIDLVQASASFTLGTYIENLTLTGMGDINGTGNTMANQLIGNSGNNILDGKTGIDTYAGGFGNDTYVLDQEAELSKISEYAGQGSDNLTIAYANASTTLAKSISLMGSLAHIENVLLKGTGLFDVIGNSAANILTGNAAINRLEGGAGDDSLDGKAGADILIGGLGDDIYVTDQVGDLLSENANEGTDTVQVALTTAGATFTLGSNFENATIVSTAALNLTGNSGANTLIGNTRINRLDGGAGIDMLVGGLGGDIYVVDNVADLVIESSVLATEIDTVESSVSWALGDNLEKLTLLGSANLTATGNALKNTLTGNAGDNRLDGGLGADTMLGGAGNDHYVVDNLTDKVLETTSVSILTDAGGTDTIESSVTWVLGNFVENLELTGSSNINGTGNLLNNTLLGNAGANILDGKAGIDSLDGGEGSDLYLIGLATDHGAAEIADSGSMGTDEVRFTATAASTLTLLAGDSGIEKVVLGTGIGATAVTTGTAALNLNAAAVQNALSILGNSGANSLTGTAYDDTINGGAGADTLDAGAGDDMLLGGLGNDILTGGTGADTFVFNTLPNSSGNRDVLTDFSSGTDVIQLSLAIFKALGVTGELGESQFWAGSGAKVGHDADDRIIYDTTSGGLYYDADGSGSGAAIQLAVVGVASHPGLAYSDLQVIA